MRAFKRNCLRQNWGRIQDIRKAGEPLIPQGFLGA
jgi:hypothetical protein